MRRDGRKLFAGKQRRSGSAGVDASESVRHQSAHLAVREGYQPADIANNQYEITIHLPCLNMEILDA